jgi:hypothetical protein
MTLSGDLSSGNFRTTPEARRLGLDIQEAPRATSSSEAAVKWGHSHQLICLKVAEAWKDQTAGNGK